MKAQFLGQRYRLMFTNVVVILHVGHHITLKHMMPRHHQIMCKCICTFVVRRKRKFGTVQINAWISTVSSSSSKPIQRAKDYRLHKHLRGEVCFYATIHNFLLYQFNVKRHSISALEKYWYISYLKWYNITNLLIFCT